jgi:hypothetical protein
LIGGHAGLDVFGNHFQHIGGQFAGDAHACDVFGGFEVTVIQALSAPGGAQVESQP